MTTTPHIPHEHPPALDPLITGRSIEVRWSASIEAPQNARRRGRHPVIQERALVVTLRPLVIDLVLLEAWLETPSGLRNVVPRQRVAGRISVGDGFLHLDADLAGRRVIALSMPLDNDVPGDVPGEAAGRPRMYAQSSLLADAGFSPGACNPPTARRQCPEADAVPA